MSIELTISDLSNNDLSNNDLSNNDLFNTLINTSNESYSEDDTEELTVNRLVSMSNKRKMFMKVRDLDANSDELLECGYYLGKYKKVTYKQVNEKINDLYFEQNEYYSSAMDILATYVKGQKLIYMEAKHYSSKNLDKLMLPSIFLTAAASVASIALDTLWGSVFLSSLKYITLNTRSF